MGILEDHVAATPFKLGTRVKYKNVPYRLEGTVFGHCMDKDEFFIILRWDPAMSDGRFRPENLELICCRYHQSGGDPHNSCGGDTHNARNQLKHFRG